MGVVHPRWPLWVVYPCSLGFFCLSYQLIVPALSRFLLPTAYGALSDLNRRCWNQNACALVHTFAVVGCLIGILAGPSLDGATLEPHYTPVAYIIIAVSLGYMSFALPWSLHMYFALKARKPYTSLAFVVHHSCVVAAELTYLLTQTCAWFGAAGVALLELTNWFFLPYVLMKQAGCTRAAFHVCGGLLVLSYTVCRVVLGSWLGVAFALAAAALDSRDAGLWAAVVASLLAYWALLALSLYWWCTEVLPSLHAALGERCGEGYWKKPLPRALLRRLPGAEREQARALADRKKLAAELRAARLEGGDEAASTDGVGTFT